MWGAIGCVVVFLLTIAVAGICLLGARHLVMKYTDTAALNLPASDATDQEVEALITRMSAFGQAIRNNELSAPLELTARDINTMIQKNPAVTNVPFRMNITIENQDICGQASIPMSLISPLLKGRWLNGSITFRVQLVADRLFVFVQDMTVKGEKMSDEFLKKLRQKNLAETANENQDLQQTLAKIESIDVRDGILVITPKKKK